MRDVQALTAECLRRTSRGQAQDTGLPSQSQEKSYFKTIQEKKKKTSSSITYRIAPLPVCTCVQVTPARPVEREFLSVGFGPSCHLPRFLEMPHSHGASPRARLINQPPGAPRRRPGLKTEACGPPLGTRRRQAAPVSKASSLGGFPEPPTLSSPAHAVRSTRRATQRACSADAHRL